MTTQAILIFDIGKTNKKVYIFDRKYKVIEEESCHLEQTTDDDGFPCEDITLLTEWVRSRFNHYVSRVDIEIKAVNVSGYGASFVCVDEALLPVIPLSNYLKPYPATLQENFYKKYGGVQNFSKTCASPALGSLNSGLQLYQTKYEDETRFKKIKWALHLPQYLSAVLTSQPYAEMTSIGCHTALWDFSKNQYHRWVHEEKLLEKFPAIFPANKTIEILHKGRSILAGIGIHDSSAALIPYLAAFEDPFILLSTGTWNISLNPFNHDPLTIEELNQDCLCYLGVNGTPVKAARLFAGHEHDQHVKILSEKLSTPEEYFHSLTLDAFVSKDPAAIAYLDFMKSLVDRQATSLRLLLKYSKVNLVFVDGGFSKNQIFMRLLSLALYPLEVFAAAAPQASALGAALAIHSSWNSLPIPADLVQVKQIHV
jgi:sugar (pentulose or hexulose) kinase